MKNILLKNVSKIHAIKCFKSTDMTKSIQSFEEQNLFKQKIIEATNRVKLNEIEDEVKVWMNTAPVVTEKEIELLYQNLEDMLRR